MANTTWSTTDKTAGLTLSNGNLTVTAAGIPSNGIRTADGQYTGKFYWEYTFTNAVASACGIAGGDYALSSVQQTGGTGPPLSVYVNNVGTLWVNNAGSLGLGAVVNGSVICFALDLTARQVWARFGASGNWNASAAANPATGAGGLSVSWLGTAVAAYGLMISTGSSTGAVTANFGSSAFTGAVPAGFTSGFTAGTVINTNAIATKIAAEVWVADNPPLRVTTIGAEVWHPYTPFVPPPAFRNPITFVVS